MCLAMMLWNVLWHSLYCLYGSYYGVIVFLGTRNDVLLSREIMLILFLKLRLPWLAVNIVTSSFLSLLHRCSFEHWAPTEDAGR